MKMLRAVHRWNYCKHSWCTPLWQSGRNRQGRKRDINAGTQRAIEEREWRKDQDR